MLYYHVLRRNKITFKLSAETQSTQLDCMFTSPDVASALAICTGATLNTHLSSDT